MRICDRCGVAAPKIIVFKKTDEHFDLCESCEGYIRDWISTPPKPEPKPRRKKKVVADEV